MVVEGVNTAAWTIHRIPDSVTVKSPYEIVNRTKPHLKNMKGFVALGNVSIPDEKRRKLGAKAFKCCFVTYDDGAKRFSGKLQEVRSVKTVKTTNLAYLVAHREEEDVEGTAIVSTLNNPHAGDMTQILPVELEAGDVIPLQRDAVVNDAVVVWSDPSYGYLVGHASHRRGDGS
ncbi:hypothetical protein PI124_g17191 [Phytophthora idaei]|nr:hypothetical protein PI125_g17563 [Phytophthora idaei]KAG3141163.1 hypothetical protein PI126_g15634 [Phytophthora idaei]KAG3237832.1 hypothetical protein PI124_g17191 [Phytophthora idaei]